MMRWGKVCRFARLWILLAGILAVPARASEPVRLGWQVPWATQGQLVMALTHTNIPHLVGSDINPVGFSYGGPLNSAAVGGQVDVLLTADQPAIVLLALRPNFRIVARMMYNRACVYVPRESPIRSLAELTGRTVMGPVGAAAQRIAIKAIRDAGTDLKTVHFGNLDMAPQAAVIAKAGGDHLWDGIDALYGFDPMPAMLEEAGRVRVLSCGPIVAVVLASQQMLAERRAELERFLAGFTLSWWEYAQHPHELNTMFAAQSHLDVNDAVLDKAASIEPNRWVTSFGALRLTFTPEDISTLGEVEKFLLDQGTIHGPVDVERAIDLDPLKAGFFASLRMTYFQL